MDFLSILGVVGGSALLGGLKSLTGSLDGKIGRAVKPLQPALLTLAGIGLPAAAQALGIAEVDPAMFVTAPTATVVMVSIREAMLRLRGKK
ncbi:hypothetical protein LCGC14_0251680 [marine sediment metagenome]|uniref:Uncharacterized protein n=1 Tax=marine sediment metagenome TaxID=412755 RepID=A0A0F9WPI9_9ZZZZ